MGRGLRTGMQIQEYQDHSLMINDREDRRLDDGQLLADWEAEFPAAKGAVFRGTVADRLDIVRSVRRNFNQGVQHHGERGPDGRILGPAKRLSLPYRDGATYVYSERWLKACERFRK